MADIHVVILAAGQGTRMKSALPKVLHKIAGRSLLEHVLHTADSLHPSTVTVVVGHRADAVHVKLAERQNLKFVLQEPQLGTAHALQQTEQALSGQTGTVVLLSGDVPLLSSSTLRRLTDLHRGAKAAATVVTATVERPYGYGRIVRSDGRIVRIVEERDATPAERQIKEINSGIYAFDLAPLFDEVIAAKLEVRDGVYTGYLAEPPLVGEARGAWVRRYAELEGADLRASYAYADSHSDLALLRAVGNPVAVSPDAALLRVAKRRRWPIEEWVMAGGMPRVRFPKPAVR